MEKNGAELLRLWTAAADYQNDIVFSQTILNQLGESYRKIRNTCRYLLSNLYDFAPARDALEDQYLRELDLLALGVLRERDHEVFEAYRRYEFHDVVRLLTDAVITMSAEYLDPVKDALYCEAPGSKVRRSVQTALYEMVRTLATWMAPILCFTAEDVADELGARHRRAVRRARRGAQRAGDPGARHEVEPQQALDRRDPPAPRGDPRAARDVPRRRAQVAGGARRRSSRPPPTARTGSGTAST